MATISENLTTAKENFAATLATISASPKPTYTIDGRTYSWIEYQKFLLEAMESIDKQLSQETGGDVYEAVISGGT